MREPAGPAAHPLGAIQAKLEQQIPQLYRELALYLQVLRDVLPASLDQACAHMATQVQPRRYSRLPQRVRQQLHTRLSQLLHSCASLLTVEQLQNLASQMARERQRLAMRALAESDEENLDADQEEDEDESAESAEHNAASLPLGSIQLSLTPPLSTPSLAWPTGLMGPDRHTPLPESRSGHAGESETEDELPPWAALIAEELSGASDGPSGAASLWSDGQLPRDPVLLIHWLEGLEVALNRRLRNLSHGVNIELMRAGLLPAVVPVRLLDSVLSGQIESHGAPANLLRLPLLPHEAGRHLHAPLGVLLRTVDLEMEQPRLRTCRRRLLHHRQEILKMAETFQRLQRRLQAQHAERLWRHDSQLTPPEGI
ncbi:MAG: hypothetical protein VKO39_04825 [Cyanobacteriota bacterium]|nr:hypothetical protein [Cyanobacteriota bacterium]